MPQLCCNATGASEPADGSAAASAPLRPRASLHPLPRPPWLSATVNHQPPATSCVTTTTTRTPRGAPVSREAAGAALVSTRLRRQHLPVHTRLLLLRAKLEVLAPLNAVHSPLLALRALQTQRDLLCRLRLLVEDGLGLPPEPSLLAVVPPLAYARATTAQRREPPNATVLPAAPPPPPSSAPWREQSVARASEITHPVQRWTPCPSCTATPSSWCASCTSGRRYSSASACSPARWRPHTL
jgi:hypothetical protein